MSIGQAVLVVTADTELADPDIGPGLLGFLVVVCLGVALIVLYRSLRRQLGRIDFDAEAESDAERMRRDGSASDNTPP